jgi:hypothetical protein
MLRLFVVVGTVPKFGNALLRNVDQTARFYTGPDLQKRTALASGVLTRLLTKLELSALYTYVDLLVNSLLSFICLKIVKLKNRASLLLARDIRLLIEKQLLTF